MENENQEFRQWLKHNDACKPALEWLGDRTAGQAWNECERADWLLWWAKAAGVGRKDLVYVACQCARRALRFVPEGEMRPLRAIETAEAWCEGKATIEQVRKAADAVAHDPSADAAVAIAAYAYASATDDAAVAAYTAAVAVAAYASAEDAYDDVDDSHAATASRDEHIAMCAIIREYIDFAKVWHA